MKRIFTLIIIVLSLGVLHAQTESQYQEKATETFDNQRWSKALSYNKILLEIDSTNATAAFKGAISAYKIGAYKMSLDMLDLIDESKISGFPLDSYYRGLSNQGLENYPLAMSYYEAFILANDGDTTLLSKVNNAKLQYESCEWALENIVDSASVEVFHLDSTVNTIYTDLSPFPVKDGLYYSSVVPGDAPNDDRLKVFKYSGNSYGDPIPFSDLEEENHIANFMMNKSETRIVYTSCIQESTINIIGGTCVIKQMVKESDGGWSVPFEMDTVINMVGYTNTHPNIGLDIETGKEILFFSSNRSGGQGGMDLWSSVLRPDGKWSSPKNLTNLNTSMDEICPYYLADNKNLFFSSNGKNGFGGFDIFTVKIDDLDNVEDEYRNLGYGLNTGNDELYYAFDKVNSNGYFVSNRPGGFCASHAADCSCNDIYKAPIYVNIEIFAFNGVDQSELIGTQLDLLNTTTGQMDTIEINSTGNGFYYPLALNSDYQIKVTKDGYTTAKTSFTTNGLYYSTTLKELVYLMPNIELIVFTFDKISGEPLNGTTIKFRDVNLRKDDVHINANATNSNSYKLEFNQNYSIYASKLGFSDSERLEVSTIGYTTPTTITKELYLQPFIGLPITLYFDNDYPNPRTRLLNSDKNYDNTYERYITQEDVHKNKFSANLTGEDKKSAKQDVAFFFGNEVAAGYSNLLVFSSTLEKYFANEIIDTLEIELQGYASPIAQSDYNKSLTSRRVDSVRKHFESYNNGVFIKYIESGRLQFFERPYGEELANPIVSPNTNNRRQSVYNPIASKERRVQILDIRHKDELLR